MEYRNDVAPEFDAMLRLQRDVTERLLLSALQAHDLAEEAGASNKRAAFLAEASGLLAGSLDETVTERAIAGLHLPAVADWCIVDLLDSNRAMQRLTIVHRDPKMREALAPLEGLWAPNPDDAFGIPVVLDDQLPVHLTQDVDAVLRQSSRDPQVQNIIHSLRVSALLTVPLAVNGNVFGAITFLGNPTTCAFSENDIRLAEGLAVRSALALEKARLYAETLRMKNRAEREAGATAAFLRSVSHELRTPLQAIAGYVEIMVRGIHGPVTNDQRIDLERIIGSQRHLLILINELIEYMRTGGTRGAFEPTAVRIDTAVRRAFDIIEPLANNCKIRFEFDDTCAQLISIADENKLHQILINLMANAVKFTAKGGEISVHCSRTGSQNRIAITDTGRGIPEDKYEAIFEPFTQLRATDRSQEGGLGLGLSISRDLARAMNGDITVQSTVKQGSTFTITLPAGPEN